MSIKILGRFAPKGRIQVKLTYVLPLTVGTVTATAITATTATLSYVLTPNTSYEYSLNGTTWFPVPANRVITGLSGSTPYNVRVRAVNRYGYGPSSSVSLTTLSLVPLTLDPAKTGLSLSNGNLTATGYSSVGWKSAIATKGRPYGYRGYFEVRQNGDALIGLGKANTNMNDGIFADSRVIWLYNTAGSITQNGTRRLEGNSGSPTDIIMVAWYGDMVWFGRNGTWIRGNPATDSNGFYYETSAGDTYPVVSCPNQTVNVTMKFTAPFTYTPPAGYAGW
jgi:hypothetical protein